MRYIKVSQEQWLETHREMLRWQKTDNFRKWRYKQFLRQGGTCFYCDEPLFGKRQNVEHITPKSRGGGNNKNNLALACSDCNRKKNTTLLTDNERHILRTKNKQKKGTYHFIQNQYRSEESIMAWIKSWA